MALTGTQGGSRSSHGLAAAGTQALSLQFETGRGTTIWLLPLAVGTERLNAVLVDADAGHRDLPEQMRRGDRRGGVAREFRPELRMAECGAETPGGFPDRVVQVGGAFADRAVELGGDEARLALHEGCIILPNLEESLLVLLAKGERVHEHHGASVDRDLAFDRERGIQRAQQRHDTLLRIWLY